MFELISAQSEKENAFQYLDLDSVMKVLEQYLVQSSVETKVAVLKWIHHLFTQAENEVRSMFVAVIHPFVACKLMFLFHMSFDQMSSHTTSLYPVLFETLSDSSDEVVIRGLTVLAEMVNCTNAKKGMNPQHSNICLRSFVNCCSKSMVDSQKRNHIHFLLGTDTKTSHSHYKEFLFSLMELFKEKRSLLENRGAFIIR